jgi:DNA polymerase III delta prime subunit
MFENIIGQEKAISLLRSEIERRSLPASILIHGDPYAGKLSTALEIARVLSCAADGIWTCRCRSCELHRVLSHPGTLLLGSRPSWAEIPASADVLARARTTSSRYLYVRAVRKLLRRCDPHLWQGAEARMRPAFVAAAEIEEQLQLLEPGATLPEGDALPKVLEGIGERARSVVSALPRDNTPIGVIRKAAFWARQSSASSARTIVIENADRMVEASRNSLLKLLEEPPEGLYLVLLTTNPQAILPTILSRVRRYRLEARSPAAAADVLARVFREEPLKYPTLSAYFLSWEKVSVDRSGELADLFLGAAGSPAADERGVLAAYDARQRESALDGGAFFREFARSLGERIHLRWQADAGGRDIFVAWNRILQHAASEQASLNLAPMLALQAALYRMRDAAA